MVLYNLKGQSNEIFVLHFIPYSNLPGPLTKQWVKIFLFWLRIRGDIQIFGLKNWLAGGMVFPGRLTRQCMIHDEDVLQVALHLIYGYLYEQ